MKKFWNWKSRKIRDQATGEEIAERVLFLNGTIAEESWFDDDVTPALLRRSCLAAAVTLRFGSTVRAVIVWRQRRSTTC